MGQIATLLKRVKAVSYTEVTSDQTHRSQTSPRLGGHHRSRSPINDRRKDTHCDNRGRDASSYHEQRRGRGPEVNQDRDLRQNLPPRDVRERINRHITDRAVHENMRRIEYDAAHGPRA
jgi:hypothetical protein